MKILVIQINRIQMINDSQQHQQRESKPILSHEGFDTLVVTVFLQYTSTGGKSRVLDQGYQQQIITKKLEVDHFIWSSTKIIERKESKLIKVSICLIKRATGLEFRQEELILIL
ncbi:hypothetical protein ACTA71_009398 [Dictyostelium dimigraforme]